MSRHHNVCNKFTIFRLILRCIICQWMQIMCSFSENLYKNINNKYENENLGKI
jgi:hypothetical protein